MNFIPLNIYSSFSYLESSLTIDKIISHLKNNNFKSAALTDLNSFSGYFEFYSKCAKNNIKPIFGLDLIIQKIRTTFLIKNETGYKNLIYISNLFNQNKLAFEKIKNHDEGLITIISEKSLNLLSHFSTLDKIKFASKVLQIEKTFNDFYIGLEIYNNEEKEKLKPLINFLNERNYNLVAFPNAKYLKEEAISYKIITAIKNSTYLKDPISSEGLNNYLLSEKEIEELYSNDEIENTNKIGEKINFNLIAKLGTLLRCSANSDDELKKLATQKLKEKITITDEYLNRLNYELSIISKMKYSDYFLLVYDYVKFAKEKNIYVGPGRGSAGGSLVAFALDIITIDPIKEGLLFERFLNEERNTMPDIDVDFEDERRDEVIDYIRNKYGKEKVINILVTQTIKAKQAIRDIGRVFQIENSYIDILSKAIKNNDTLKEAYKNEEKFKELLKDKYYLEIVKKAQLIEGLARQPGIHPSGIVINNDKLDDLIPLFYDENLNRTSQFDKDDLEQLNFLKMDLLGIRNLTIIKRTIESINAHNNEKIEYEKIPYLDESSIKLIASLNTLGIFQLESQGMNNSIKILKPTTFEDIVSLISLYRPGPKKFILNYAKRKYGQEEIKYPSNKIIDILKPTYGIIIYQEQIMQIVQKMAAYSYQKSDLFRRAIAKKDESILKSLKEDFIKSSIQNGNSEKESNDVYNLIFRFANYGFNKSHAVAYAKLACMMAYLKYNYPLDFYISLLELGNDYEKTIEEIKRNNIVLLGPSINKSSNKYQIVDNKILLPLNSVKTINNILINEIIKIRGKEKYKDFIDFIIRTHHLNIQNQTLIKLIECGVFDEFNTRNSLINSLDTIKKYLNLIKVNNNTFDISILPPPNIKTIDDDKIINAKNEYNNFGFTLSNVLDEYKEIIENNNVIKIKNLKPGQCKILGFIKKINIFKTKKNDDMAFVLINDFECEIELLFFPDILLKYRNLIVNDKIVLIVGRYDSSKDKIIVDEVNNI